MLEPRLASRLLHDLPLKCLQRCFGSLHQAADTPHSDATHPV